MSKKIKESMKEIASFVKELDNIEAKKSELRIVYKREIDLLDLDKETHISSQKDNLIKKRLLNISQLFASVVNKKFNNYEEVQNFYKWAEIEWIANLWHGSTVMYASTGETLTTIYLLAENGNKSYWIPNELLTGSTWEITKFIRGKIYEYKNSLKQAKIQEENKKLEQSQKELEKMRKLVEKMEKDIQKKLSK